MITVGPIPAPHRDDDDGRPVCPDCGELLVHVTRYVGEAERRILDMECHAEDDELVVGFAVQSAKQADNLSELLEEFVRCENSECGYVLAGDNLGDTEYRSHHNTFDYDD